MSVSAYSPRIGIYGPDEAADQPSKGCNLWPAGYGASVTAAGGTPVSIEMPEPGQAWDDILSDLDGVIFLGQALNRSTPASRDAARQAANEERLCQWCKDHELPFLGVDRGLHALNTTFGGTLHLDLARELPNALQHRHPPEPGVRHAIMVTNGTHLAELYGEGEIVVNSEHTRAIARVARGFRVSGRALDGVVEAMEYETDDWFALGVQWHPASVTASGLDIQVFRGLVDAARQWHTRAPAVYQYAA
jgi:putative glutamine amidotransferase